MEGFGFDLSEKLLKNLVKASDYQAEYGFAGAARTLSIDAKPWQRGVGRQDNYALTAAPAESSLPKRQFKNEINGPKSVQFAAKPLIEQVTR
jgi:hypothetical protein